jgi:hypothetical protein
MVAGCRQSVYFTPVCVPVTTAWRILGLRMEESCRVSNKQSRTTNKGWSSSLSLGEELITPHLKKNSLLRNVTQALGRHLWTRKWTFVFHKGGNLWTSWATIISFCRTTLLSGVSSRFAWEVRKYVVFFLKGKVIMWMLSKWNVKRTDIIYFMSVKQYLYSTMMVFGKRVVSL